MTFPVLSLLRRRRNLFIFVFVIGAATVVGNPPVRARFAEAVLGRIPNLVQAPAILDPAALKTDGQYADGSSRGARTSRGDLPPVTAGGSSSLSLSPLAAARLTLDSPDDVASAGPDLPAENESSAPDGLLSHRDGGLSAFPSPIGKGAGGYGSMAGGAGGGGGGIPGGFSPGVRSNFNSDLPVDDIQARAAGAGPTTVVIVPRAAAARARIVSDAHALVSSDVPVSSGVPFDPNMPFGASDLTKIGAGDGPEAGLTANNVSGAPLATPEPGTLLLVANGVIAALGSRAWRRRRNR